MKLCSKCVDDSADQKGSEKTLSHGTKSIDSITFYGNLDVFASEKCFKLFHNNSYDILMSEIYYKGICHKCKPS